MQPLAFDTSLICQDIFWGVACKNIGIYTHANTVVEGILFLPWLAVCRPSVCPSVCLFVEKLFPHTNYISFWPTMMLLHTCIAHNWRKTPIDFGVNRSKVKVKLGLKTFVPFPLHNSITFWHTMILHTWVNHDPKRTSIDFGSIGQRSRSN